MAVSRLQRLPAPMVSLRSLGRLRRRVLISLIAWWQVPELDRQLAAGVSAGTGAVLALRARRITTPRARRRIAHGLSGALRSAQATTVGFTAAVRPHAPEVLAARAVMAALEQRLCAPEPVTARGVAMLNVLLADGTSPFYQPDEPGALGSRLRAAAAALEPIKPCE